MSTVVRLISKSKVAEALHSWQECDKRIWHPLWDMSPVSMANALAPQHPAKDDPQALVRMGNSLFFGLMVAVTGVYLFYEGFLIPVVLFIKFRFPERVGSSVLATPGDEEDFCSFPGS
jgi:hypothetical protein